MDSGAKFLLVPVAILPIGKMLRSLRQLGWQTWSGSGNWKELVEPSFGHRADHWSQRRSQITKVESCLRTKFLRQKFCYWTRKCQVRSDSLIAPSTKLQLTSGLLLLKIISSKTIPQEMYLKSKTQELRMLIDHHICCQRVSL